MTEPLVAVRGLTVAGPGGRVIVDDVAFDVAPGETVGLVGESGSGKSMTVRAVAGLLPAGVTARGAVRYGGDDLLGLSERELKQRRGGGIGYLMQDPFTMLNPLTRVRTTLKETLAARRPGPVQPEEIERRLAEVGIHQPGVADRYPFELSGGMRQRVALAAALANDPRLLIADEPTTALDATTQRDVLRLLRTIQRARGMGLVLITHDLQLAFGTCGRVLVMYAGSLLEEATPERLQRQPGHPYTRGLLDAEVPVGRRKAELRGIPGRVPRADEVADRCTFASRCAFVDAECLAGRPPLQDVAGESGQRTACVRFAAVRNELAVTAADAAGGADVPVEPAGEVLVDVRQLTKRFVTRRQRRSGGGTTALDEVTLQLREGRTLGVVGESGSGKSTLGRCLLGLERPEAGRIELAGHDVSDYTRLSRADLRRVRGLIQCVFQDPYSSLNAAHTVGFALEEALRQRSDADGADTAGEVTQLLEAVGLAADYARRYPAALSGGERQRIAIARALAVRPRVLVCDEPTAALDLSVQAQVLEVLRNLRQTGVTLLFITHDLGVVRQMTDEVVVLHRGRIVETGPTATVLDAPEHSYTRRLVAALPRRDEPWLEQPVEESVAEKV